MLPSSKSSVNSHLLGLLCFSCLLHSCRMVRGSCSAVEQEPVEARETLLSWLNFPAHFYFVIYGTLLTLCFCYVSDSFRTGSFMGHSVTFIVNL